jgi:hypothetical protein
MTEKSSTGMKMMRPWKSNGFAGDRGGRSGARPLMPIGQAAEVSSDRKVVVAKKRVKAMQRLDMGTLGTSFIPSPNPALFRVFWRVRRAKN